MNPSDPGADPYDWISHNIVPCTVDNVDPMLRPLRAHMTMDMVIRTTGQPDNDCTMTLWDGGGYVDSVTIAHNGNTQMASMTVTLDMGRINDYYVTVYYDGTGGGANPTWVFQGKFSSGHTKELKHVFKEDSQPANTWTIDSSLLKGMLVGEEIVFTAVATDPGSDDLVFLYSFGDGTYGANAYANELYSPGNQPEPVYSEVCTDPEDMNAVLGVHEEPEFDYPPNDIRSPEVNPIGIVDSMTHAFSEQGFYYVDLTVMDDDIEEGYPSHQLFNNGGGYDMDYLVIDLS
jgi:hypothetical protein